LFGAGKSATVLIDYLVVQCHRYAYALEVIDAFPGLAADKVLDSCRRAQVPADRMEGRCYSIDNDIERQQSIRSASLVISLLPPPLHAVVATDCLESLRPLFTASYIDEAVRAKRSQLEAKGLLFLYEMGLDPGIDHMSLMELLDGIRAAGGEPTGILSHCGGLVSPVSDDNPWHYKISWNPRNVVMAGSAGARFLLNGEVQQRDHAAVFSSFQSVEIPEAGPLAYYPNRDSLPYMNLYGLSGLRTFQRTTLRHSSFLRGWNQLVRMGMIDEVRSIDLPDPCSLAAALLACAPLPTDLTDELREMLEWLGWSDHQTRLSFIRTTPAQLLQFCLETKWKLEKDDKDRIVMLHEIEYQLNRETRRVRSWLIQDGEDATRTAMAKTVGLPLGIAAIQYLQGVFSMRGLQIPTHPEIYRPVLRELRDFGIEFQTVDSQ